MSLPYFPMYPTDFEAKTSHLTLEEDGAYNRLLRLCWMSPECSLPDNDAWIMRRMRVDADTYERVVRVVLSEFFTRKSGRASNARLSREFAASSEAHARRVFAGKQGGNAKALKDKQSTPSNAKAMLKQPEPEPEPEEREEPPLVPQSGNAPVPPDKPPPKQSRRCRLPDGWVPSERNIQDAEARKFTEREIQDEADKFRDHHAAKGTTFADWDAGWRTWLGNARKFGARGGMAGQAHPSGRGQGGSIASIVARRWAAGENQ